MRLLKRHRIGLVLMGLRVVVGMLVAYRLEDQPATAGLVSATDYENARTNAESSSASVRAAEAPSSPSPSG